MIGGIVSTPYTSSIEDFFDLVEETKEEMCMMFHKEEDIVNFLDIAKERNYCSVDAIYNTVFGGGRIKHPIKYVLFLEPFHTTSSTGSDGAVAWDTVDRVYDGFWVSSLTRSDGEKLKVKCFMCDGCEPRHAYDLNSVFL